MTDIKYWDWAQDGYRHIEDCREFNIRMMTEDRRDMDPSMPFVMVPPLIVTNEDLDRCPCEKKVKEMEKNGMISPENTPPEDETKCASEDQLEEHACKRFSDCACQAKAKSESAEALKAFRDGGCCGN